ncbi:MAG TPA: tetratricopeptide repeat protein [Pyrinomonadaceae bacterium]|nr:tetratricopeptide repeat protein [Pyrinomonadaceae bacterium]
MSANITKRLMKAIAIEPNEVGLYLIRADFYKKSKNNQAFQTDIDTTISIVNKAIETDPKNAKLFLKRAYIYYHAGNKSAVTEDVKKAISINPNDFEILRGSRQQLKSIGEYEESLEIADKIISLDASNPSDFYSRFFIKKELKDFRGAVEDGIKSLELTDITINLFALGDIHKILQNELKDDENLPNYYERILVILDKRALLLNDLITQKIKPQSIDQLKIKQTLTFIDIKVILNNYIELCQKKGMLDKADELIEQISKYEPVELSSNFHDEMRINQKVLRLIARGDSFLAQKEYDKAVEYYEEAIKLNNSKEAHQKLFQALQIKVEAESK